MKRSRFTVEQIAFALKQADSGTAVLEVCRQDGHKRTDLLSCRPAASASTDPENIRFVTSIRTSFHHEKT
jgi:Transposase